MKFLSAVLLVALTMSQVSYAAKGSAPKARPVAEIAKAHLLDRETIGRDGKDKAKVRMENIKKAAPKLADLTGIAPERIVRALTFNTNLIDMVLKASETEGEYKTTVKNLVELYAVRMDSDITLADINSPNNKQMSKLSALLGMDKVAQEYLNFAKEVAEKMETMPIKEAMESAAKKYAEKKFPGDKDAIAKWLKLLEDCIG